MQSTVVEPDLTVQKVNVYKANLLTKAEELIKKGFPRKIVALNDILDTEMFLKRDLDDVHQDLNIPVPAAIPIKCNRDGKDSASEDDVGPPPAKRAHTALGQRAYDDNSVPHGTPILALPSGSVICNTKIDKLITVVKPIIRELVEDANLLKMWVSFLIPKIEDGNNFGVSVQEETLAEIQTVESEAAAYFDQISRYFLTRAKLISKVAKYPHIQDYRRAVSEIDEKEYLSLWLVMCEVRNRYSALHDIVTKNFDKLKKPRSANSTAFY